MKKFKVERESGVISPIYVILYQPPYENENILNKTGWKSKDVKITEIKFEEEE